MSIEIQSVLVGVLGTLTAGLLAHLLMVQSSAEMNNWISNMIERPEIQKEPEKVKDFEMALASWQNVFLRYADILDKDISTYFAHLNSWKNCVPFRRLPKRLRVEQESHEQEKVTS